MTIIEQFLKLGRDASYHYADDSGAEWDRGGSFKKQAMDLYDAHPDLQDEMLEKADFLWSLKGDLESRYFRQLQEIAACMSGDIKWRGAWGRAAIDAKKAYPDIDPKIIEAMGVAMTTYRRRDKEDD